MKEHSYDQIYSFSLWCLLFSLLLLGQTACTFQTADKEKRRILVLHSQGEGEPYYPGFNRCIRQELKKNGVDADLKFYYLDCEVYNAQRENENMLSILDSLQPWQPELILANDDEVFYNLLNCGHPMARQVPIVFAGVNFPNWELMERYRNITGYLDIPDYRQNIELIKKILGTVRIIINYDETILGQRAYDLFIEETEGQGLISNYNRLSTVFPEKFQSLYNPEFLSNRLAPGMQRPDSLIIDYIPFRKILGMEIFGQLNGIEEYYTYLNIKHDYMTIPLGRYFEVPTFTSVVEGFGYSDAFTGGYFTSYEIQAADQARLAALILNEKVDPSTLPIRASNKEYVFDWDQMQHYHIPRSLLPPDTRIVDMPFYERHKVSFLMLEILTGLFIFGLITYLAFLYSREASRKRAALQRLRQERESLALAIEGGNTFAWKFVDDQLIFDNDFFSSLDTDARIFTSEEFIEMVHPEERKEVKEKLTNFHNRIVIRRTMQFRCNFNGEGYQWWEFRHGLLNQGLPPDDRYQINGLCLNIQKTKENEASLIAALKKAEESDRMKSAFLANMSHEIRTPLNAIVGFANLITSSEAELTGEEKEAFLQLINSNCDLLLKLINDILDLSRIESGRMDFVFAPCDLNELIVNIYQTHQLSMPPGVELKIRTPEAPLCLETDKHRLMQVLSNFINNAAKFTSDGYIEVGYFCPDGSRQVHLYVEDTGKGIPGDKQKEVFERFNKLDEFIQGTGLGLAICKVIAERFRGEITLQSEEGKGSRFTLILPLEKTANP